MYKRQEYKSSEKKIRSSRTERFYKNKKRAGLYDMKTKDLFRMEYAQILIYIVFLGLLEVLLFIFEVNYFLMIYLLLIGLILEGVYLCQRYMKKYRYYKKVKAKLDILEQKCMITEMLELPDFAEGEFLYEILQTCNKSMNDEILKYKIEAAGYREYICLLYTSDMLRNFIQHNVSIIRIHQRVQKYA